MRALVSSQRRFDRRFYIGSSLVFFALMFWAFARTYFLKLVFNTPVLTPLVHIHGVVMTGWAVLLVIQTSLVVANRVQWHRRLGTFGGMWAILVVVLGSTTTLHAAAREVREHSEKAAFQVAVLGLELLQMFLFATLVGAAVLLRHRTDYHKRLMLLTSACMLPSIISRLPFNIHGFQSILFYVALFVIGAICIDTVRNRRLHPAFGWGAPLILISLEVAVLVSETQWWHAFGTTLVS